MRRSPCESWFVTEDEIEYSAHGNLALPKSAATLANNVVVTIWSALKKTLNFEFSCIATSSGVNYDVDFTQKGQKR